MEETCPKCGHPEVESDECMRCRVIVTRYRAHLEHRGKRALVARKHPAGPARRPQPAQWDPPQTGADRAEVRRLSFEGTGGSLFGIHIVNVFLTVLTLGVYYVWAKVRVRRYVLSQTEFEGDRFAYHGTGKELATGLLKAAVVFGLPVMFLRVVSEVLDVGVMVKLVAELLAGGIFLVFYPVAMVGARRYRLSRTSWRGIRFSFRGRALDFIKLFVGGSFLTALTLGLYAPIFAVRRYEFMTSHSYFGTQNFRFDGQGRDLLGSYLLALLLTLPTLGLCWFWFLARKRRYLWDRTSFGDTRFHSTVTGGRLLALHLGNLLLLVVTLGLASPWVKVRNIRFAFQYLTLEGTLDLAGIEQEAQVATATGEGLASFLDTGFDFA
ncbi:MAG: YjgN family protein [Candidatus Methylomirabilia bacterium]